MTAPVKIEVDGATSASATIFVCTSCRRKREDVAEGFDLPGPDLVRAIEGEIERTGATGLTVTPVECLAVCKRPCTVALVGQGKWTYLVGDLETDAHTTEIVSAALAFARSENGIVPWKERPQSFRRGVVARIPPLGFVSFPPEPPKPETT